MSSKYDNEPIRIVRKKKRDHGGHHGGAWKVAYADFVTAMMALFIVLWIVGQSKNIKSSISNYFKDPGAFFDNTKGGGMFQGTDVVAEKIIDEEQMKREKQKLEEMAQTILKEIENQPQLKELAGQIEMEIVKEGLRIELLETSRSFFFDIGTSSLKAEAVRVLTTIAEKVALLPNHIIIEGHTDSRPYSRKDGYTNFELSADRANSARRMLVRHGVGESQIDEVRGYADKKLRNTKDPYDVTNRRISIIIEYDKN